MRFGGQKDVLSGFHFGHSCGLLALEAFEYFSNSLLIRRVYYQKTRKFGRHRSLEKQELFMKAYFKSFQMSPSAMSVS